MDQTAEDEIQLQKEKEIKEKSRTSNSRWRNARAMLYPMGIACLAPVRQVVAALS